MAKAGKRAGGAGGKREAKQRVDEALLWACETLGSGEAVKQGDSPSGVAWFIYTEMRDSAVMKGKGFDMLAKLMPTRTQLDELLERFSDDGRAETKLIDRLIGQVGRDAVAAPVEGGAVG